MPTFRFHLLTDILDDSQLNAQVSASLSHRQVQRSEPDSHDDLQNVHFQGDTIHCRHCLPK